MFKGEDEFRARGFGLFPWHKVDIYIDLNAVDNPVSSNAEFCLFWKRTYGFVHTLKKASSLRRIIVSFWYHKGNDWNITGIPRHTRQPSWKQIQGQIYGLKGTCSTSTSAIRIKFSSCSSLLCHILPRSFSLSMFPTIALTLTFLTLSTGITPAITLARLLGILTSG